MSIRNAKGQFCKVKTPPKTKPKTTPSKEDGIAQLASVLYTTLGIIESIDKTTSRDIQSLQKDVKILATAVQHLMEKGCN